MQQNFQLRGQDDRRRRAAEYVRMSTEHQQYSTENQADRIRDYAKHNNIDIERIIKRTVINARSLAEALREGGYRTASIGKWHLGLDDDYPALRWHPINRGFKETFGFIGGGHRYQNWKVNPATEYLVPIERNGQPVEVAITMGCGDIYKMVPALLSALEE